MCKDSTKIVIMILLTLKMITLVTNILFFMYYGICIETVCDIGISLVCQSIVILIEFILVSTLNMNRNCNNKIRYISVPFLLISVAITIITIAIYDVNKTDLDEPIYFLIVNMIWSTLFWLIMHLTMKYGVLTIDEQMTIYEPILHNIT